MAGEKSHGDPLTAIDLNLMEKAALLEEVYLYLHTSEDCNLSHIVPTRYRGMHVWNGRLPAFVGRTFYSV